MSFRIPILLSLTKSTAQMRAYLSRLIWGSSHSTQLASQHSANMVTAKDLVESTIKDHKIAIFSKSWCPFCGDAKSVLLNLPNVDREEIKVYELDEMGQEGAEIQAYLAQKTKQRTVPNIFINTEHVGGADDLRKAQKDGRLKELLNKKD